MKDSFEHLKTVISTGYTAYSGVELTDAGDGYAEGRMMITENHRNPYGNVHGGAIFCLGDVIGGAAFRTYGGLPVTLSSNISYMRAMKSDHVIYARADVIKYGKTTSYVEIKILNEQKVECARIAATYYNVEGRS